MCGRFLLRCPPESWPATLFGDDARPLFEGLGDGSDHDPILFQPRANVSPTQSVFALIESGTESRRELRSLRWGLVPSWADDKKIGASMINARSETVDEKRSFKKLFSGSRCLIPADGYYEWLTEGKKKQPHLIQRSDQSIFCFAGLWERNSRLNLETCTIITTAASPAMSWLHDRMPVIISPEHYDFWLNPKNHDVASLKQHLHAEPDGSLVITTVDKVGGI